MSLKIKQNEFNKLNKILSEFNSKTNYNLFLSISNNSKLYRFYELRFALICGFILFSILFLFYPDIERIVTTTSWFVIDRLTFALILAAASIFSVLIYFVSKLGFLNKLIVPKKLKKQNVLDKAKIEYLNNSLYSRNDNILQLYIAAKEREVEFFTSNSNNINKNSVEKVVSNIALSLKKGNFIENFQDNLDDLKIGKVKQDQAKSDIQNINFCKVVEL